MLERAANQVQNKAVNTLRDSLDVALGSGSAAESTMTWRRGEQDLQQRLCPTSRLSYARGIATEPSLANSDFIMAVQMLRCSSKKTCPYCNHALHAYFGCSWPASPRYSWPRASVYVCIRPHLEQRSGELL
jgi:hypothetical protein